ncbi:helix-turn-helix transcriptional regulator [Parasulfitobacter algicola]|uniref:Helix-turn-helix transcriptional regulator n=1 Tax=Parasulfitobacter algicola TaxID=2614809 RepID=A0ABX2IPW7_9RHOB|nr:helix-turn-helix transcriptional regulator [Sulfitobacter algicola]NSX54600.1 helix-turn-helix transcriptional regulator [Sulfitobacter algicola]
MSKYQYIESGLDNVYINGLSPVVDDDGDEVITVPYIAGLHVEIARGIVTRDGQISGRELRFLRTEMGMTQAELAAKVNADAQTIGRWERDEYDIDPTAETVIRRLAGEKLIDAFDQSIDQLLSHVQTSSNDSSIIIDAQGKDYKLCA